MEVATVTQNPQHQHHILCLCECILSPRLDGARAISLNDCYCCCHSAFFCVLNHFFFSVDVRILFYSFFFTLSISFLWGYHQSEFFCICIKWEIRWKKRRGINSTTQHTDKKTEKQMSNPTWMKTIYKTVNQVIKELL